ncbi:uncharacterized protein LOC144451800 [Glandiceps talaboti]
MFPGIFGNSSLRALLLVFATNIYVGVTQELTTLKLESHSVFGQASCFTCTQNGKEFCIAWSLRCDGKNDCDLGEDETYERCYGDSCVELLEKEYHCNGINDCTDGRDEYHDKCQAEGTKDVIPLFGNVSVAVAVIFLLCVMIALSGLLVCICCCCRKGIANRPYISKSDLTSKNRPGTMDKSMSGHRWVSYSMSHYYDHPIDGSVAYCADNDSVQVNVP